MRNEICPMGVEAKTIRLRKRFCLYSILTFFYQNMNIQPSKQENYHTLTLLGI